MSQMPFVGTWSSWQNNVTLKRLQEEWWKLRNSGLKIEKVLTCEIKMWGNEKN